jgi:phosphoglycerate kinase
MIIDIGKDSLKNFNDIIRTAHTIVWNGPIGYCEVKKFCYGTHEIARTIASRTGRAKTIVGGGDTLPVLDSAKLGDMFTLVSTGGGAMLEFLSGNSMPGINPLKQ